MTEIEKDTAKAGAPDLGKQREEIERQIREEVENELGHLTPIARETVVQSRLKLVIGGNRPELVRTDLGENAGKKVKDLLFE